MLEIGSSLRQARDHRGVALAQAEEETRIRSRYLRALEDERFDLIPGTAYVRAFLRTYADYLGLEAEPFVDEYNERFAPPEEPLPELAPLPKIGRRGLPLRATVGVAVVLAIAGLVWALGAGHEPTKRALPPAPPTTATRSVAVPLAPPRRKVRTARLVLTAVRGRCWLSAHVGSANGRSLGEATLEQGQSLTLAGRRLWIRLGAPQNLEARLNGEPEGLPGDTADVVVTATGIQTVG